MSAKHVAGLVAFCIAGLISGCGSNDRSWDDNQSAGSAGQSVVSGGDAGGQSQHTSGGGSSGAGAASGQGGAAGGGNTTSTSGAAGSAAAPSTGGTLGDGGAGAAGVAVGGSAAVEVGGSAGVEVGGSAGTETGGTETGGTETGGTETGGTGTSGAAGAGAGGMLGGQGGEGAMAGEAGVAGTAGGGTAGMCGNGDVDGAEECDGANLDGNDCTTLGLGFTAGTLGCIAAGAAGECTFDVTGCSTQECGNGDIEGTEECDAANLDGNDCTTLGLGFTGGTLGCVAAGDSGECTFDTSDCWTGYAAGPGIEIFSNGAIWDLVQVSGSCVVSDVTLDIDLTHTYIGDLIVELTSPAGTTVRLHNRTGSSADDIVGNYPLTLAVDGPGVMGDFIGENGSGWWRLDVSDNAAGDVGVLNSWALNIDCSSAATHAPELAIPDATAAGVTDSLVVAGSCSIADISVPIDLTHTYIGDLIVELTSPAGTTVRLHNRTGGSTDNIVGDWDGTLVVDGPGALSDFIGEDAAGTWSLWVSDNASVDTGTLASWGVDITCSDVISASPGVPVSIPDSYATGIVDTLRVSDTGCTLSDVNLDINLTHTYIGDLIVELTSPAGTTVRLHNRTGSSADNIIGNYPLTLTEDGPGAMSDFAGEALDGDWVLHVSDNAGADLGSLNSWSLNPQCT